MGFLQDYLQYNSNNECPENYHIWSALALLSAVVSRKVVLDRGHMLVHANLYICLVGTQGGRKSTAKDIARDLLTEHFPRVPVSPSTATKEYITKFLSTPESIRTFRDVNGVITEYHPYILFINELKNFLNVNPAGMVDFIVDIYDRKIYDVGTKNKGEDFIPNPYIVMLACETPEWIRSRLKLDIISGGFTRRVIFVYELGKKRAIPFPDLSEEDRQAKTRVIEHLRRIEPFVGEFKWTPKARVFFEDWYKKLPTPQDPIMGGFYSSIDTQLLKVAMLLALCEWPVVPEITADNLQLGIAMFQRIEPNMTRLTQGVGRNELAGPTAKLMDLLEQNGGEMVEKRLQAMMFQHMYIEEYPRVLEYLRQSEQIAPRFKRQISGVEREVVMTLAFYEELKRRTALTKEEPK